MLVLIAQCLSPTTARQWRRAKRCQAGVRHRDSDYGAHTAGILSAPQRPTRTRSRRKTSCQTTCTCINETVKTDPSVMRVREHVDCTCVCDGNCFVISVLSHSLSCSLVSVRTLQCSAQCMVLRSEVTDGTIELELNFVHMWETKETVLTGREEAALDS